MKQVIRHLRTGKLDFLEAPALAARHGGILVRTSALATSPGTDQQIGRLQSRQYTWTETLTQTLYVLLDVLRTADGRRVAR